MTRCLWYISKYVGPPTSSSPGSRGYLLMKEFAKNGYQSVIITSDANPLAEVPVLDRSYMFQEANGVHFWWVRTLKFKVAKSFPRVYSVMHFEWRLLLMPKKSLPKPDVIIVSSLSLLTILNGLLLQKKYKCRMIFEIRDIWPLTLTEEGGFSHHNLFIIVLGWIERIGYHKADAIVGTMPNLKEHVKNVLGYEKQTWCIPMGVDSSMLKDKTRITAEYVEKYLPVDKFIVVYAGTVGFTNALEIFFDCAKSFSSNPEIHFLVVGDGDLLELYKHKYGHLVNLSFAPKVEKNQVQSVLEYCDLLYYSTHPSKVWLYGQSLNKLIDYMLSGKPIVASYTGYKSMINESNCGSFVPAGDLSALHDEIIRYYELSPEERFRIGARGREWLIAKRNYRQLYNDYLEILFADSDNQVSDKKIMIVGGFDLSLILFRKEMIETWVETGYKVIAAAPGNVVAGRLQSMGVTYYNISIARTGLNPARDLLVMFRLWLMIRREKPDYLFLYTIKPVIYGSIAAALVREVKVFSMISGLGYVFIDDDYENRGSDHQENRANAESSNRFIYYRAKKIRLHYLKRLVIWLYRAALKYNEKVFFQNPDDIEVFTRLKIVKPELVIQTNGSGVNLDYYSIRAVESSEDSQSGISFLLIARLLVEKGINEYVAAARIVKNKYPQTRFMLLGWLFEDNPSAIPKNTVEAWREEGLIEIYGETDDVRPYIASASVYVLPSYREGTPRTVLEAMAMKKPIITTDVPGCRETVRDGVNGYLVKVKDKYELAMAMEKFIQQPELIEIMGAASRKIVEEKYNVHKVNQVINKAMDL